MENRSSNYWKKRGQHNIDYVSDPLVIWSHNGDLPLVEKTYIYEGHITPTRVIKNKNIYEITHVDQQYIINGFMVITQQDLVHTITIFGFHPNRDPDTNLFCLPDYKKGVKYTNEYYQLLLTNIKTYYLDNCFFIPGSTKVEYKKIKSIYMKMNKGEKE